MLKKLNQFGAVTFLVVALGVAAFGWDETGHKISAYIAWSRMSPETRERVVKILLAGPEDSDLATFYLTYGTRAEEIRKREYFMLISTWADIIRDRSFEVRYRKYHRSNWHYSDTFWTMKDGKIETLKAPEDGGKALERLIEDNRTIRGNAPDAQKAVAIAWLEHLIGDLHQPLHTSARVTDMEKNGDQGGNLFLLTPQGTPRERQENLHWFWDSIVVRNIPNKNNECDQDYVDPIAEKILRKYPYSKVQARILPGKFEEWIKESLAAAQTDVFSSDLKRFEMPSDKYKKKALKIAEERLALAGYRMAEVFNQAFAAPATAPAGPN